MFGMRYAFVLTLTASACLSTAAAFASSSFPSRLSDPTIRLRPSTSLPSSDADPSLRAADSDECDPPVDRRRRMAIRALSLAPALASYAAASSRANAASSELFKPNPLTNSVLEQVRIWNQDEADNIRYGGELESGSAKPAAFEQYVGLLQPILEVERDLGEVNDLLNGGKATTKEEYEAVLGAVDVILTRSLFDKINFKKAFNAFADNIYYSDPDRANLYLGGGAIPKTTQSIAYLLRNDILTNVEDMRAEVRYLLRELAKKSEGETVVVGEGGLEVEDIMGMSRTACGGMKKYLDVVPPRELEAARMKFSSS